MNNTISNHLRIASLTVLLLGFSACASSSNYDRGVVGDDMSVDSSGSSEASRPVSNPSDTLQSAAFVEAGGKAVFAMTPEFGENLDQKVMGSAASASICPQLVWVRDQGKVSIWRATRPVYVVVTQTRKGKVTGSVNVNMKKNDTLRMLIWDGRSGDGFYRCVNSL